MIYKPYKLTFTHKENWRCALEALDYGIKLRNGDLPEIANICHQKGIVNEARYAELSGRLEEIERLFRTELDEARQKSSEEIKNIEELSEQIKNASPMYGFPKSLEIDRSIEITRRDLVILEAETERLARTYMAQLDVVSNLWINMETRPYLDLYEEIQNCRPLINGLRRGAYFGVYNTQYHNDGRILFDIYQVLRHRRSYDDNPGITPQNRWRKGCWGVNFDEPAHFSRNVPLIEIVHLIRL